MRVCLRYVENVFHHLLHILLWSFENILVNATKGYDKDGRMTLFNSMCI